MANSFLETRLTQRPALAHARVRRGTSRDRAAGNRVAQACHSAATVRDTGAAPKYRMAEERSPIEPPRVYFVEHRVVSGSTIAIRKTLIGCLATAEEERVCRREP